VAGRVAWATAAPRAALRLPSSADCLGDGGEKATARVVRADSGGRAGEHVEEQSLTERGTCAEPRGPFGWATRCAYERWRQKGAR